MSQSLLRQCNQPNRSLAAVLALLTCTSPVAAAQRPVPPDSTPKEVELGKKSAQELEAKWKVVDDKATTARLTEMAQQIGRETERPKIQYVVKVVKEETPNAVTLPGGLIYATTGLLSLTSSDNELAAVLAHEIAHNAKMHALKMLAKQKKLQWVQMLAFLGAIAARDSSVSDVALFSQLLLINVMSGYSVEMEAEADAAAISYLQRTQYSPVAVLTFMEKLAYEETRRPPQADPGIFRTHPPTQDRIDAATKNLQTAGIPLDRRAATGSLSVSTVPKDKGPGGEQIVQVLVDKEVFCDLVDSGDEGMATERAKKVAERLDRALSEGLRAYDLVIVEGSASATLMVAGKPLVVATQEDAKHYGLEPAKVAQFWKDNLKKALWRDQLGHAP